jgi:putative aminopeptidase FrvX
MSPATTSRSRVTRDQLRLLQSLTEAVGVSGGEDPVREVVRGEIEPWVRDLRTDGLGNLLAVCPGRGRGRLKIMLAAHMDEVGFMITDIDADGFLSFQRVGGVDRERVLGHSLWVGESRRIGVVGTRPIHLMGEGERSRPPAIESLRIDIGVGSRQDALKRVQPGDRASFATSFQRAGGILIAKALDDRLGVATLIELSRDTYERVDVVAAFTVQEETGQSGARVAAQALDPDLAIVLEATPARDLPTFDGGQNLQYNVRLGEGPAIYVADRASVSDPRLVSLFTETAERLGLPCQIRQPGGGHTDASAIHLANAGIPCISVSVPVRYIHGPAGMARIGDWRACVTLVREVLSTIRPTTMKRR